MKLLNSFDEVMDAVEQLPVDEQAELVDVIRRRLAERGRLQVIADAAAARAEHAAGKTRVVTVDQLMSEINS
jgi:predicted nucleic acid-binding protein